MSKTPTINQYLLDLVAKSRLTTAEKGKDPKAIARAHAAYDNLSEEEVTFSKFTPEKGGKYRVTIKSVKRGWELPNVVFNTGTLQALARKNQQGAANLSALDMVTVPGLLYVAENDSLYLVVEKDTNVFDALKLTGYEFPADSFTPEIYPEPNTENRAVGQVDIDHPVVVGRFLINYIDRSDKKGQNGNKSEKKADIMSNQEKNQDQTQQNDQTNSENQDQRHNQIDTNSEQGTEERTEPTTLQDQANAEQEDGQQNPTGGSTGNSEIEDHQDKTPTGGEQSEGTSQSNSADGVKDPLDTAEENQDTAEQHDAELTEKLQSERDQQTKSTKK